MEAIRQANPNVVEINLRIGQLICDQVPVESEAISEAYWERLTGAIERWQPKLTSSYYLHALIEVSVVANDIRWISREGKKLLLEHTGECSWQAK